MSTPKKDARKYGTTKVHIKNPDACYMCGSGPLPAEVIYCPNCGFPQRGSEAEQKRFIVNHKMKKTGVNEEQATVGIGKLILFFLGGINILIGVYFIMHNDTTSFAVQCAIGGIYIGLGLWAIKKPYPALLTGLIIYFTFIAVQAMLDPSTLFAGVVLKVGIASGLIYGMAAVKKGEKLKQELELRKVDLGNAPESSGEEVN